MPTRKKKTSAGEKLDIVAAGHICVDITPVFNPGVKASRIDEVMKPGKLVNVGMPVISTGGSVSNTGLALVKFGMKTALIAKVGRDGFGKLALDYVSGFVKDTKGIRATPGEGTSYTIVVAIPGLDRIFLHDPGTNDTFRSSDIDYSKVSKAKLFHFGYPPLMKQLFRDNGGELLKIFKKVKSLGLVTSLDMTLPDPASESGGINWHRLLENVLPFVDIFLPSYEEVLYMLRRGDFESRRDVDSAPMEDIKQLALECLKLGVRVAVIKCGHRGIYLASSGEDSLREIASKTGIDAANWAGRSLFCPAFKAEKIASATGSGDSAIAGFLAAMLRKKTVEDALVCANTAGLHNLRGYDSLSGLGDWKEVEANIQGGRCLIV